MHLAPMVHKTKKKDDIDTLGWWEATTDADLEHFHTVMGKKTSDLVKHHTWSFVLRIEALDEDRQMIPRAQRFKKKRLHDGTSWKHKTRFCVCGDLQKKSAKKTWKAVGPNVELSAEAELRNSLDTCSSVIN